MSYLHFNHVRENSRAKGLSRLVLLIIADRANEDGIAWPGLSRLSKDCNACRRAVQYAIDAIAQDELKILSEGGSAAGGQRRSTKYQVLIPKESTGANKASVNNLTGATVALVTGANHALTGANQDTDRCNPCTLTTIEPSIEPSIESPKGKKARKLAGSIDALILPLFLDTPEFRKALSDWQDHKQAKRDPLTQRALELIVRDCEKWGLDKSITLIHEAIKRGWKGIFETQATIKPSELTEAEKWAMENGKAIW